MTSERCSLLSIIFFKLPRSGCKMSEIMTTSVFWSMTSTANTLLLLLVFLSFERGIISALYFFTPILVAASSALIIFELLSGDKVMFSLYKTLSPLLITNFVLIDLDGVRDCP